MITINKNILIMSTNSANTTPQTIKSEVLKSSLTQIDNEDYKKLTQIITEIKECPDAIIFLLPVDTTIFTDYLKAINDRPMDISTIELKLSQKRYHFIQDVFDDFQLIWDNCRIYNKEGFEIYNQADKMEKVCLVLFEKYYHVQKSEGKNFVKEFDNNVYDEEAFNDPNYYKDNISLVEPYYKNLRDKIYMLRLIKSLTPEQMKQLVTECKDIKSFITINEKNNYNIHVECMESEDLCKIQNEINKIKETVK